MKTNKFKSSEENLFQIANQELIFKTSPLSVRMRPQTLDEYVGQTHILSEGTLLHRAIQADRITSVIFYGPPGTGKTTLAHCISKKTNAFFERVNAVSSNVEELRRIIVQAKERRASNNRRTILFIDETHRFNKAQQDVLMPDVEEGNIVLIGATTMNPFFALTGPLISRSMVFELKSLSKDELIVLFKRALSDRDRGLGDLNIEADEKALDFLAEISDGDARRGLNALEVGCLTLVPDQEHKRMLTLQIAEESIQRKQVLYDADGDQHYDTVSAFIKSMRGSDPDATLYWLAKMLYAGEDHRFIARRICICASEDVGNADPRALILANAALQISEFVGLPEARIILAQAAVYIACAPKSNAAYAGIEKALEDVKSKKILPVPNHLKDASYAGAKKLERGQGYKYAHDYPNHYVDQEYMPEKATYYQPTDQGYEKEIQEIMRQRRKS